MSFKKSKSKIIIITILVITCIGIIAAFSMSSKKETNPMVEAYISKALFGSIVNVKLTDEGSKKYPNAKKYEIYYKGKLASAKSNIGESTTVFPKRTSGDRVEVHLLTSSNKEIAIIKTKLKKK